MVVGRNVHKEIIIKSKKKKNSNRLINSSTNQTKKIQFFLVIVIFLVWMALCTYFFNFYFVIFEFYKFVLFFYEEWLFLSDLIGVVFFIRDGCFCWIYWDNSSLLVAEKAFSCCDADILRLLCSGNHAFIDRYGCKLCTVSFSHSIILWWVVFCFSFFLKF